jgi:ketosteroid isomerase-like protein
VSASTQSNSELIKAYLDAVMRKDVSVIDRFFASDVELAGRRSGNFWTTCIATWRPPRLDLAM